MQKEYIEREAARIAYKMSLKSNNHIVEGASAIHVQEHRHILHILDKIPAADVVEVRHGRWLLERTPDGKPYCFHCSVCDDDFHHIGIMTVYDYCPNCGAYMMGESNGKCE